MEIAITLIITAIVAIYVSLPFFLKKSSDGNIDFVVDSTSENLYTEKLNRLNNSKETLLSALKDIEFDYGLGKLSKEDFEELSSKYKAEAASILKQIDNMKPANEAESQDSKIEEEILLYRKIKDTSSSTDSKLEAEIEAFRTNKPTKDETCSNCGAIIKSEDIYCSKCGEKLR